jgi:hypothetical protein
MEPDGDVPHGHRQVIAPAQFRHWCQDFIEDFFSGRPRR